MDDCEDHVLHRKVGDSVPVIVISLLLFILPVRPNFWCWRSAAVGEKPKTNESLIDWSIVQNKVPWGLFLLIGRWGTKSLKNRIEIRKGQVD